MNTQTRNHRTAMMALGAALLVGFAAFGSSTAEARDARGHVAVSINNHRHHDVHVVRHHDHHANGHWEWRTQRVLVAEGHWHRVWHPAVKETVRGRRGNYFTRVIRPGHWDRVWHPPVYENRRVRVWVPHYHHGHNNHYGHTNTTVIHRDRPSFNLTGLIKF